MQFGRIKLELSLFSNYAASKLRLIDLTKPDFLIIGAQKAGTSSLYKYLIQHKDIQPALTKEVHYYDLNYHRGINWYKSFFKLKVNNESSFITGEASPYYLFHPLCPERVFNDFPDIKLIVVLRDPIERAISHYHWEVKHDREKLSLEDAIEIENERLMGEVSKIKKSKKYNSFNHQRYSYLSRGFYWDQIKEWNKFFNLESMLFVNSDDLFFDTTNQINRVCKYLNLEIDSNIEVNVHNKGKYNKGNYTKEIEKLRNIFYLPNKELSRNLNIDFNK